MNDTAQMIITEPYSGQQDHFQPYNTLTFLEAWTIYFQGKISKDKLYSLVRAGKIPHLRVGTKILFRRTTLDAWFQQQELSSLR